MRHVDEILDFAINEEEAAARFYAEWAGRMDTPWMRRVLEDFSREEEQHKAKLEAIKRDKRLLPAADTVTELKIADYLAEVEPTPDMDYQQALILAMEKEKAAFRLYSDLEALADDEDVRAILAALAQEEARHKLRFEVEYDEQVLTEN